MKLTKFTIKNFRSITEGSEIDLTEYSVLVGRNNEGKTTVLLALKMAMDALINHGRSIRNRSSRSVRYEWDRDFPISLQNKPRVKKETVFRLYFELDEIEQLEFKKVIKSVTNGDLCIEITFDEKSNPEFLVPKRGSSSLTKKSTIISKYIAERIQFTYIPAVRTEREAISAINEMIEEELARLENEIPYKEALNVIEGLQQPVLDRVSRTIETSLQKFLPNIKAVSLGISDYERKYRLRKDYFIEIDDGNKTNIQFKGDGVKSLAAVGLLKDRQKIHNGASIIAIEEPESHLHPSAMHSLKCALEELSTENQLIISTHNPIFVHREKLTNNILVSNNKVKSVKKIQEIRECLGVRTSDNLLHSSKIILVEGESDKIFLTKLIQEKSSKLARLVKDGDLAIVSIDGAGKLAYNLKWFIDQLCSCFVVVDNDLAAKESITKLLASKELDQKSYCHVVSLGMIESELENLLKLDFYRDIISNKFGIDLMTTQFSKKKCKWSDALTTTLQSMGKTISVNDLNDIKKNIAQKTVKYNLYENISNHNQPFVDNLVIQLERYFIK
ncbi:ATP-dependent nuclease [Acinetobacter kanungonis]|uniref:ATP-dependent nuclease n=1 Tax=Acinetobacter kanungonis TaxID=2699469 RepID=UPI00137AB64E|nr:ATP-binding protein [Acinetobacter kanungonis]NCI79372.1 AAA family ATPase [Acinetobacter kanungonis]